MQAAVFMLPAVLLCTYVGSKRAGWVSSRAVRQAVAGEEMVDA